MRPSMKAYLMSVAASAVVTSLTSISARAQQAPPPPPRPATYPAAVVLGQIGQSAGVTILADSTVQGRLPMPAVAATAATVEQQIADMVRALPAGTTCAKLYVPAPANGRWSAEVVANYARALAQVVGPVGRAAPAGTVEILGRHVPADKANDYISALNLKLVYLVTNTAPQRTASTMPNWSQMTPDQRDLYAQQQAQRLMALSPANRFQAMLELMQHREESPEQAVIQAMWSQLSDDDRVQLKQGLGKVLSPAGGGGK